MGASRSTGSPADAVAAALEADRRAVRAQLERVCARRLGERGVVGEAIRYALLGTGKLLRPILLLAAYRAAGGTGDAAPLAAAPEVVHAYSLVHDDLPCMDDDHVRRGRPTTHRVFGAAVAAAAGVAMVPLAAEVAIDGARALRLPRASCSDIVRELMRAAGAGGMVGGQVLDLAAEGVTLEPAELERVHRAKTGALIAASVTIGGIAAQCSAARLEALRRFGCALGLAFQIADDVLDATSTTDTLGKSAGRDAARRKSTYPALLGVQGARDRADAVVADGCEALRAAALLSPTLDYLARFAVARTS
jgi:geranylgeranyl pyrophosphate synthase